MTLRQLEDIEHDIKVIEKAKERFSYHTQEDIIARYEANAMIKDLQDEFFDLLTTMEL